MKKIAFLFLFFFIFLFTNKYAQSGTIIFEEPTEKSTQDKAIYDVLIHSEQWYLTKSLLTVKAYSKQAKIQKENDIKNNEKKLSLYIQKIADKYKIYFEDVVDIFNDNNKKYSLQISGDEKNPLVIVKNKNV